MYQVVELTHQMRPAHLNRPLWRYIQRASEMCLNGLHKALNGVSGSTDARIETAQTHLPMQSLPVGQSGNAGEGV